MRSAGLRWARPVLLGALGLSAAHAQKDAGAAAARVESVDQTASVRGFVEDTDGAGIAGAQVVFFATDGAQRTSVAGADGGFRFDGLPAGAFHLSASAAGFSLGMGTGTLQPKEVQELSTLVLTAGATEAVEVTISRREVAAEELHAEEHQRLIGMIPNYFVAYDWHAPPLTPRQKFELTWKTLTDPVTIGIAAATAGVQQAAGGLSGYGPGAQGYAKRFGAELADETAGNLLGGAVLPVLLHQDPRYFYKGTGSVRSRLFYALSTSVISRGDNGKWQPAYASIGGDFAAGALTNLYYPASDRSGVALTFENGVVNVALDGVQNVIQEFLLKHLTSGTPSYAAR